MACQPASEPTQAMSDEKPQNVLHWLGSLGIVVALVMFGSFAQTGASADQITIAIVIAGVSIAWLSMNKKSKPTQ